MITSTEIISIIKDICLNNSQEITLQENTPLLNGDIAIDSMVLIQLCIALEEKSNDFGFDFDWTSEKAMSSMNSIFKTPKSLSEEFNRQLEDKKHK